MVKWGEQHVASEPPPAPGYYTLAKNKEPRIPYNKTNSLLRQDHNDGTCLLVSYYGNMFRSFFRPSSVLRSNVSGTVSAYCVL
jgi:hypothetical protein